VPERGRVLTNCDEVELRYGDGQPKRIGPDRDAFPHLPTRRW